MGFSGLSPELEDLLLPRPFSFRRPLAGGQALGPRWLSRSGSPAAPAFGWADAASVRRATSCFRTARAHSLGGPRAARCVRSLIQPLGIFMESEWQAKESTVTN